MNTLYIILQIILLIGYCTGGDKNNEDKKKQQQEKGHSIFPSESGQQPKSSGSGHSIFSGTDTGKQSIFAGTAGTDTEKKSIFAGTEAGKSKSVNSGSIFSAKQQTKSVDSIFAGHHPKPTGSQPTGSMFSGQGTKQSADSMFAGQKEQRGEGQSTQQSKGRKEKGIGSSSNVLKRTKLGAGISIGSVRHPIPTGHTPIGPVVFITGTSKGIGEVVFRRLMWQDGVRVIIGTLRQTDSVS